MKIGKGRLIEFLKEIDKELAKKIKLIAVGGTAMTLLGLKPSTIDIDFEGSSEHIGEFEKASKMISHGFRVDTYRDGLIFTQQLPDDYSKKSIPVKKFNKISLYALHPIDIVVTKIGRLDGRDFQDIEKCIKKFKLKKEEVKKRAGLVEYVGNEENYKTNLKAVLKRFF